MNYVIWEKIKKKDQILDLGSGYYNSSSEALDSEVVLVTGGPTVDSDWGSSSLRVDGQPVNSVSARWQTLTWDQDDFEDKYIYLRHTCQWQAKANEADCCFYFLKFFLLVL